MSLSERIETAYAGENVPGIREDLVNLLDGIESGDYAVAEKAERGWVVNDWVKKGLMLVFRHFPLAHYNDDVSAYYDRVPPRFLDATEAEFVRVGARVTPGAIVRRGTFLARDVVLMPSFVNIGASVGEGTMIDTWATVGSCAQVGARCHISGGAGHGGVLEPVQATPTIIEDGCFVGARSEVVEGVVVEENAVIGMGVFIGQSTPIYNRETGETTYGRVPSGAVVVSGVLNRGDYGLNAAIIVKTVDAQTREKTAISDILRGIED